MPTSTPTLWNIPYQRNPYFTGREDVLAALHRALHAENTVALSHPQGISGLGGIGKTQTALEYAYRYRDDYDAVFWVRADSITALTSSLVELAHVLQLPERDEKDQEIIVQAVLRWLRLHPNWLLIYDNIDELSVAEPFLPKAGSGHLLFTTRVYAFGGFAERLDIQKMEPDIGALLLLHRAEIIAIEALLDVANPDDQNSARAISQELDGLPLALDQAGAYIKEAPCLLVDYLSRYQIRRSDILHARGQFDQDYPASVATTWSLSFEKVREANPSSAELLNFCAFLAPEAIPETMITEGATHLPPNLQDAVVHPVQFDRTITALLAYSLLRRNANETLNVHRLVQAVLRDDMSIEAKHRWKQRAVLTVNTVSPNVRDFNQRDACEQWLPHAQVCATWIEEEDIALPEAADLLNLAGYYLDDRARYEEAEPVHKRALEICMQQLGANHLDTAQSLNNLAVLYQHQGKYKEAEPLLRQALEIHEQQLGTDHPSMAMNLNNIGVLYESQGKYEEAESLLRRALEICEQQLGANHPDTAQSLNNLAVLYKTQGKYAEAEPLLRQALSIREQQLGADHPDTAQSLNNLADLYNAQGKYAEAESLFRQALEISEQKLGTDHPDTARSLNNLAMLYQTQGKYEEAEPLLKQALEIYEQRLGADHPSLAMNLNNLAVLYKTQGKYEEAEPLLKQALEIYEQQLGANHPDTALGLNNLAMLYQTQGKYAEVEPLLRRVLEIYEQQLGTDHLKTALSLNNLAMLYQTQRKYKEVEPLLRRVLGIYEQQLGADHLDTARSLNNLAMLYQAQRKYAEAEPLLRRAFEIYEQQWGTDHPDAARNLYNLASFYHVQRKYTEAEPLYMRALEIYERQLGTNHPDMARSLTNLATLYQSQGKYEEAEPLLRRALEICEQQLGTDHPDTQIARRSYATLQFVRTISRWFSPISRLLQRGRREHVQK